MKRAKKFLSLLLSAAIVLSLIVVPSISASAATLTASETYAVNTLGAEIGETLLFETFDKGSSSRLSGNQAISNDYTQRNGWEFYDTNKFLWHANASTFQVHDSIFQFWCSNGEGLVVLPQLNATDYIYTAKIKRGGWGNAGARVSVITSMGADVSTAPTYQRFGVKYDSATSDGVYTVDDVVYRRSDGSQVSKAFTGSYDMVDYLDFTVISYKGTNYYFIEDEFIFSDIKVDVLNERLGVHIISADAAIDEVTVKKLNTPVVKTAAEKYAENTLGAELGDVLLEESFSKGSMSAAVSGNHVISSDYTQKAGWEFFDTGAGVWHANAGSCIIKDGFLNFYCSYGDSAVLLPQLNTSDYVFTAKLKRGGWGNTASAIALVTDVANDARNTSTFQRFSVNFNGESAPHTLTAAFVKNNSKTTNYTINGTYDMGNYVDFTIVSFKGMKYFFIEDELVATAAGIVNEGERIGFYISTKSLAVDDVVVKKLNVPTPAEEKFAATLGAEIGEVLLEEHFDKGDMAKVTGNNTISGNYTQMPGWEFYDTAPFIWHSNAASFRISNGAANFWCSNGNAALILPQLNESNYVFTAKIKRSGWGSTGASAGILTDLGANLDAGKPQIRFIGYYDSATEDGAFPFTKVITRANDVDKQLTIENTYDLAAYVDFGVVSYEGTNYYFLNGDYIGSAAKVAGEGERLGFYLGTADISVDDVYVKELNGPTLDVVEIAGINAVKVAENVADNNAYKVSLTMNADVAANVGFFTADADSAATVGYVEGENATIISVEAGATAAEAFVTVDKKGGKNSAVGSDLYMYVIDGDVSELNVSEASAVLLTDVTGEKPLIAHGGASILKNVAENAYQALRYYFNYDTINGNDIVIDGEVYTVKSRGFLLTNGGVNADAQITRSAANGTTIKDINVTKLDNCWESVANNDALNSDKLTYSIYATGFKPVNGTYNNTNKLYVKGYVVVEINGVEYTLYSEEYNTTVSEVANLI